MLVEFTFPLAHVDVYILHICITGYVNVVTEKHGTHLKTLVVWLVITQVAICQMGSYDLPLNLQLRCAVYRVKSV